MSDTYTPDAWLLSLQRALADYTLDEINNFVLGPGNAPVGLAAYDVVFDWPESDDIAKTVEFPKSVIHFVIDDISNRKLGLGADQVAATEEIGTGGDPDTITWEEGQHHVVNFDVGFWASDKSGGSTARLVVYQMLQRIFGSQSGRDKLQTEKPGISVIRFNGGRMITDRINDVRVFRIIDVELVVQVFSRVFLDPAVIVEETVQQPSLQIDNAPIS
jgi:hypothetical protein